MKIRAVALLSTLLALAYATTSRADDTTDIESILSEHVISTASATAQRASVAPALSTTISAEDIQALGIRSMAEAINFLSLGVITSDPLRTPDIGARGVLFENDNGKHFLLLLNGHAINDPLYGTARFDQGAGVPLDLVDHIEVVVGPGSVLYGSNAMMGVINVITKSAADYPGGHVLADYEVGRSYRAAAGSGMSFKLLGAPSELTAGVEYYGRYGPSLSFDTEKFDIGTMGSVGVFSHINFGRNLPANVWGGTESSAYFVQAPSAMMRLRSGDFEVNVFANAYRRGIPYSSSFGNVQFDDAQSSELDRSLRVDVKHQATLSNLLQLTSRVYADSFDYQRHLDVDGGTGCLNGNIAVCQYYDAGVARWAGAEERLALNWLHDQSLVTTLGVDGRVRWVGAKEDVLDTSTNRPIEPTAGRIDDTGGIVSPYIQQTYRPASWVDMNAGARLDMDSRFSPVLSPRGALAIHPFDKTTLKLIYSQAFRAPTIAETSLTDYQVAPSPNLKPETVRSVEVSVEQRFAAQRLLFGVFRTWWQNLIEFGPVSAADLSALQAENKEPLVVGNLIQYENVANVDNFGWNGAWEGSLLDRRLQYGANATGAFTRLGQGGQSSLPPVAPQVFGNLHIAYAFGAGLPTPALTVYGVGPRAADRAAPDGAMLPAAPALADVRVAVTGRVPSARWLGYVVTADYTTASYGPYTSGPTFSSLQKTLLATATQFPPPGFAPIDQFRVMVGLRFDFLDGSQSPNTGDLP
jgi:outer membrane receptor protein involved in Fe transport